jgi:hypothetical protein
MSDKVEVEVTGKSKYEVAQEMARLILTVMEQREIKSIKRSEYLLAVAQSIAALHGSPP